MYEWILFTSNDYLLLESCQLYIIVKYKVNSCSKIRPDLPNLFFLLQVYEINKISVLAGFDYAS